MDHRRISFIEILPAMRKPPGLDPRLFLYLILPALIFIAYVITATFTRISERYEDQENFGRELIGDIQGAERRHHRSEGHFATLEQLLERRMLQGALDEQGRLPGRMGVLADVELTKDGAGFEITVELDRKLLHCDEQGSIEEWPGR